MRHEFTKSSAKCQISLGLHVKYRKQNLSISCYFIYKPSMSQPYHTAAEKAKMILRHLTGVLHRRHRHLSKPFHTSKASSKVPAAQETCGQVGGNPKEQKNGQTSRAYGLQRKFERTGIIQCRDDEEELWSQTSHTKKTALKRKEINCSLCLEQLFSVPTKAEKKFKGLNYSNTSSIKHQETP